MIHYRQVFSHSKTSSAHVNNNLTLKNYSSRNIGGPNLKYFYLWHAKYHEINKLFFSTKNILNKNNYKFLLQQITTIDLSFNAIIRFLSCLATEYSIVRFCLT